MDTASKQLPKTEPKLNTCKIPPSANLTGDSSIEISGGGKMGTELQDAVGSGKS